MGENHDTPERQGINVDDLVDVPGHANANLDSLRDELTRAVVQVDDAQRGLLASVKISDSVLSRTVLNNAFRNVGTAVLSDAFRVKGLIPEASTKMSDERLMTKVKVSESLLGNAKLAEAFDAMAKLNQKTAASLMPKFDFGEPLGASNAIKGALAKVAPDPQLTAMFDQVAGSFTMQRPAWQTDFSESIRRHEAETSRRLAEVNVLRAKRDAQTIEAEQAAITTSQLIESLVELVAAQSAQQQTQALMLGQMTEQIAELTSTVKAQADEDNRRWRKAWLVQRAELLAAAVAAALGAGAIWASFAAAKPPVVNVPAPIVRIQTPAARPVQQPPADPAVEQPGG